MKTRFTILFLSLTISIGNIYGQQLTTIIAKSDDISRNLDLELVATLFGEAETLADFELSLNDPGTRISNLDLNQDDEVDYLRVFTENVGATHFITIQAVLGFNQYQDVATIDVIEEPEGTAKVQVVGNSYIYGSDYIISILYDLIPEIIYFIWNSIKNSTQSRYGYNNYPPTYCSYSPLPIEQYQQNALVQTNTINNSYQITTIRNSETQKEYQSLPARNALELSHPEYSPKTRNHDLKNKQDLVNSKPIFVISDKQNATKTSTSKKVDKHWKPASVKSGRKSKVVDNQVSITLENPLISKEMSIQKPLRTTNYKSLKKPSNQPKAYSNKPKKSNFGKTLLNSMFKGIVKTSVSNIRVSKSTNNNKTSKTYKSKTNTRTAVSKQSSKKPRTISSKSTKSYQSSRKSPVYSTKKSTNKK